MAWPGFFGRGGDDHEIAVQRPRFDQPILDVEEHLQDSHRLRIVGLEVAGDAVQQELQQGAAAGIEDLDIKMLANHLEDILGAHGLRGVYLHDFQRIGQRYVVLQLAIGTLDEGAAQGEESARRHG